MIIKVLRIVLKQKWLSNFFFCFIALKNVRGFTSVTLFVSIGARLVSLSPARIGLFACDPGIGWSLRGYI
jgi:hypothetical protein